MCMYLSFSPLFSVLSVVLWLSTAFGDGQCSQLYLQPVKDDHAYFTGDNFFVTCFTTDKNIDKLTWTDFEGNPISTQEGGIYTQPTAEGDQLGLRLVFTNVETEDAGTYTCSDDQYSDDQDSVNFDFIVNRGASFTNTASEQHAAEGETGTILCNVKSDPILIVNWYFHGEKISNNQKYKIHRENHSLMIHNISREDAGEYKCKAFVITRLSSQIKDFNIKLQVQYIPEVTSDQRFVSYASLGMKKNLTCTVTADPAPNFEWFHDDMIIYNTTKSFIIHNNTDGFIIYNTENTSTLQMTVDDEDRFGEYICLASNGLGQEEVIIDLEEGDTPLAPELSVVWEDQGVVKLEINAQDEGNVEEELKVTGFKVEYIFATESWDSAIAQDFQIGESYELKKMSFNSEYILRAAAHNAAGYGNFSKEYTYKTISQPSVISSDAAAVASSLVPIFTTIFFLLLL